MKREREPEGAQPLIKTLTEPQKILVLASMLPCGSCAYYCNVTGNASSLCVRCNKPARAHGDLVDTGEIERRWSIFTTLVTKYDEQNTKDKEVTTRMITELLTPVNPDPPLNAQPPFEEIVVDEMIVNIVRVQQMRADAAERELVRQGGVVLSQLISSSVFFKTVVEYQRQRTTEPQVQQILDLWRRYCHQCRLPTPEEPARSKMCDFCLADFEAGTRVTTNMLPVAKCFGLKFVRAFWENIKHLGLNVRDFGMPAGAKQRLEGILRDFETELQLGASSMVFRRYCQVRLGILQALVQALQKRAQQQPPPPLPVAPSMAPPPVMPKLVRAPSVSEQLSQLATPPMPKKIKAEDDGKPDSFLVKVVNDTKSPAGWELLIGLKEVISKQLPEMPKYYIMRALFDGHHESLCVLKNGKVVGGCTFRPFVKQGFVEVVFLVVNPNTTNKGLGSLIMTEVKTFVHTAMKVDFLLTYADNTAIDFFKKQGFSKDITLPRTKWAGYIKDYTKATLMEYHIAPTRDAAIAQQAQWVKNCVNATLDTMEVHKGFSDKTTKWPLNPKVLGVNEERAVSNKIIRTLRVLKRNRYISPFLKPVDPNEAPRYAEIIKNPISLEDVEKKFERKEYSDLATFEADLKQIAANCMIYNHESTWYYKYAEKLLEAIQRIL